MDVWQLHGGGPVSDEQCRRMLNDTSMVGSDARRGK